MENGPLTRREYDRLVARGVFEGAPIELLRGRIVVLSPQGEWHSELTRWLGTKLARVLDDSFDVRQHSPYAASAASEPEPDISVSIARKGRPCHPSKALLLIEVAESSLARDRGLKAGIYADNGAAEYWIVDVKARCVWVFTDPVRGTYRNVAKLGRRDTLVPMQLPDVAFSIADLFARR